MKRSGRAARAFLSPSVALTWAGMSRHEMTVSSGNASGLREGGERATEESVACGPMGERESDPVGAGAGCIHHRRVSGLGKVEDAPVIAEVILAQLGMPVQSQRPDDEGMEVPHEEVRQVIGAGLLVVHRFPLVKAGIGGVAMGAGKALGTVALDHTVEGAGSAA